MPWNRPKTNTYKIGGRMIPLHVFQYQKRAAHWMFIHTLIVGLALWLFSGDGIATIQLSLFTLLTWMPFIHTFQNHDGYGTSPKVAEIIFRFSPLPPSERPQVVKRSWNKGFIYLPKSLLPALALDACFMIIITAPTISNERTLFGMNRIQLSVLFFLFGFFGLLLPRIVFWFRYNLSLQFWKTSQRVFTTYCDVFRVDPTKRDQIWAECLKQDLVIPEGEPT